MDHGPTDFRPMGQPQSRLVYDVGMHNGDDCAYYLRKGMTVVAIDANPAMCAAARRRFEPEIAGRTLIIINAAVSDVAGNATFYVHKSNSVVSTLVPPTEREGFWAGVPDDDFEPVEIATRRLSDIVHFFGAPYYIKIDVEGFDAVCLADLHRAGIKPSFISAEAHSIDTYCHLVAMGYVDFKMVAGATVEHVYANHMIERADGAMVQYGFPMHSAGPFGDDIVGGWMDKDAILTAWLGRGPGWFDIHARRAS